MQVVQRLYIFTGNDPHEPSMTTNTSDETQTQRYLFDASDSTVPELRGVSVSTGLRFENSIESL